MYTLGEFGMRLMAGHLNLEGFLLLGLLFYLFICVKKQYNTGVRQNKDD